MSERRLGRGLEALLGQAAAEEFAAPSTESRTHANEVSIDLIRPNPVQPRKDFAESELHDLCESIRSVGVLQPLLVRKIGEGYELIAGERRLRAARMAGLAAVPVRERSVSDEDLLALALIENLQREDLNPIEKAKGFRELIDKNGLTQEAASAKIGKDRSTLANFMRLLELAQGVQDLVARGALTMGHARALAGVTSLPIQEAVAKRIVAEGLSVRQIENIVGELKTGKPARKGRLIVAKAPHIKDVEDRVRERLGTRVEIAYKDGRGKMTIQFFNDDDFQRVLDVLGIGGE